MKYVYVIEQATDGSYSAYVPDLPGCTSCADSLDDLKVSIAQAVEVYIESLREQNEPIPAAGSMVGTVEAA